MPKRALGEDTSASKGFLLSLGEITASDVGETGSKAANLGELKNAGCTIPDGFALTTRAFEHFLQTNGLGEISSPEVVLSGRMPEDLRRLLASVSTKLGDVLLAVRSSGVSEDLSDASFAGQYETVLGVSGEAELEDAIKRCWASAFSTRVKAYGGSRLSDGGHSMAVLIQQLVRAEAAGVAFTANPVTGERSEVVVNSVRGLGERLVSGEASPDDWRIRGSDVTCKASPEGAITPAQALQVAELARRVEAHFGSPQDIEWAISSDTLYLLQARPMTSLLEKGAGQVIPVQTRVEVPEGYWQWDEEHFPGPLTPMDVSLTFDPTWFRSMQMGTFRELGLPIEGIDFKNIGGYPYMRIIPPGGKDRRPPPSWLMPILVRVVPQARAMNKKSVEAVRGNRHLQYLDAWYAQEQPDLERRTKELLQTDFHALSDAELERRISSTVGIYREAMEIHMRKLFAMALPVSQFSYFCEDSLRWERRKVLEMLGSGNTSEPSRRLAELARMASGNIELVRLFRTSDDKGVFRNLAGADPRFAEALSAYLREYGCTPTEHTLYKPTFAENPLLIVKLIRGQMSQASGDPVSSAAKLREGVLEEARRVFESRGRREELETFERLLKVAERAYPTIDATQFYNMRCRGLFREEVLELGSRLRKRDILAEPEDAFFLEIAEALSALRGSPTTGLRETIAKRKGEYIWAKAHPGPKSYGKPPGPPPSMKGFPPEVRAMMRSFMWMSENMLPGNSGGQVGASGGVAGIGASSGRYTGPVRLVRDESEFGKIRPGDVLVCRVTSPTWTVLFPNVGALVTDIGGLLSHPAIIAREYRIPAVLATAKATQVLHDGDVVTVDGDAGTVKVETSSSIPLEMKQDRKKDERR